MKLISAEEFLAAVAGGDASRVQAMLDGAPELATVRDPQGVSAPLFALYRMKKDLAEILAAKKEAREPLDVFEAAAFGRVQRLEALLAERPAAANDFAIDGFYPLGLAAFYGHEEAVALLLARGADPNLTARNTMKVRPLHAAAAARSLAIATRLLTAGAEPDARQQAGYTPLHEAAGTGQIELARLLIDRGADANAKTDDGSTPLALARKGGYQAMADLLLGRGARG